MQQPGEEESEPPSLIELEARALLRQWQDLDEHRTLLSVVEREHIPAALAGDLDAINTLVAVRAEVTRYRISFDLLMDKILRTACSKSTRLASANSHSHCG
jgi:hypothetical protein